MTVAENPCSCCCPVPVSNLNAFYLDLSQIREAPYWRFWRDEVTCKWSDRDDLSAIVELMTGRGQVRMGARMHFDENTQSFEVNPRSQVTLNGVVVSQFGDDEIGAPKFLLSSGFGVWW